MKVYLGDAVYADVNDDNYLVLTTEDGISATNTIYLEPGVVLNLLKYLKSGVIKERLYGSS